MRVRVRLSVRVRVRVRVGVRVRYYLTLTLTCVLREPCWSKSERRASSGWRKGTMSSPRCSQKASNA